MDGERWKVLQNGQKLRKARGTSPLFSTEVPAADASCVTSSCFNPVARKLSVTLAETYAQTTFVGILL